MYSIETASRRVEKEIADLPHGVRDRVIQAIRKLKEDPRPPGVRRMMGAMCGVWRIRGGDYRMIYDVHDDRRLVIILSVLHRRQIYRRL